MIFFDARPPQAVEREAVLQSLGVSHLVDRTVLLCRNLLRPTTRGGLWGVSGTSNSLRFEDKRLKLYFTRITPWITTRQQLLISRRKIGIQKENTGTMKITWLRRRINLIMSPQRQAASNKLSLLLPNKHNRTKMSCRTCLFQLSLQTRTSPTTPSWRSRSRRQPKQSVKTRK